MKKIRDYALIILLAALVSGGVSLATVRMVNSHNYAKNHTTNDGYSYAQSKDSLNEYGFKNTSLSFTSNRPVGSAPDLTPAAEASVHAVVHIKVEGEQSISRGFDPFEFFFGGGDPQTQMRPVVGYGSGVIISSDGYIITNNHVIEDAKKIEVTLNDNRTFKAEKVGSDPGTDIALLKVDAKNLPTIPFGDSDEVRLGEWVLAVGNPFNLTSTVTAGIISAKARGAEVGPGQNKLGSFIQTDAAVNAGNSGGALVNAKGELIGINTMIYSQTGAYSGYSFAVPINTAAKVVNDIRKYGTVQRAILGIVGGDITQKLKEEKGLKVNSGAYVADFAEVSPAYAAGMDKDDVITAINGKAVNSFNELQSAIGMFRPGDKIKLTINRKGKEKELTVTLKNIEGGEKLLKASDMHAIKGLELRELSNQTRRTLGISYGMQIEKVNNAAFKKADIQKGFIILSVNDRPIRNQEDFEKVVGAVMKQPLAKKILVIRGFYPNTRVITKVVEL